MLVNPLKCHTIVYSTATWDGSKIVYKLCNYYKCCKCSCETVGEIKRPEKLIRLPNDSNQMQTYFYFSSKWMTALWRVKGNSSSHTIKLFIKPERFTAVFNLSELVFCIWILTIHSSLTMTFLALFVCLYKRTKSSAVKNIHEFNMKWQFLSREWTYDRNMIFKSDSHCISSFFVQLNFAALCTRNSKNAYLNWRRRGGGMVLCLFLNVEQNCTDILAWQIYLQILPHHIHQSAKTLKQAGELSNTNHVCKGNVWKHLKPPTLFIML